MRLLFGIDLYAINYSTFAASTAILCFFVNQNLLANRTIQKNKSKEDKDEKKKTKEFIGSLREKATIFLILGILNIVLFAIIVTIDIMITVDLNFYENVSEFRI